MNLVVTQDPKADSAAMNLTLDPRIHIVLPDGLWVSSLKRQSRRQDLFLYWHRRTGRFVLAAWLFPDRRKTLPVCVELDTWEGHPDWIHPPLREMLTRLRITGAGHLRQFKSKMMRARSARQEARLRDIEEKKNVIKFLRGKGQYEQAALLENGIIPWLGPSGGGEKLQETKRRLLDMLNPKVYSVGA